MRPGTRLRWDALRKIFINEINDFCTILDIGGYDGFILSQIKKIFPNIKTILLDVDTVGINKAKENGLHLTIHAGEGLGPKSVWDSIKLLNVERIGHGVRSIEDISLIKYLAKYKIPLEISPTSNLKTGIYSSYQQHPLRQLYDAGVQITVNTDDPTFFNTTLADEYFHIYNMGLGKNDIYNLIRNGFLFSFLQKDKINKYLKDLEDKWKILKNFI